MKRQSIIINIFIMLVVCLPLFSQEKAISNFQWRKAEYDTAELRRICEYGEQNALMRESFWDSIIYLSQKNKSKFIEWHALSFKGYIHLMSNKRKSAIQIWELCLSAQEFSKRYSDAAALLNNLAYAYEQEGNITKALEMFFRALHYLDLLGEEEHKASVWANIASIYSSQEDYKSALENYLKALNVWKKLSKEEGVARTLNNIGHLMLLNKRYAEAQKSLGESMQIAQRLKYDGLLMNIYHNLGNAYFLNGGSIDTAKKYLLLAFHLGEKYKNPQSKAGTLATLAKILNKEGNAREAIEKGKLAMEYAKESENPDHIQECAGLMRDLYKENRNSDAALEMAELYIQMRDSIKNEKNRKASLRSQIKYEYDKKAAADSVKAEEEKKVTVAQLQQEKTQRVALYGGLILVLIFSLFMVNRFRVTQKQKKLIEVQKKLVETQKQIVEMKQNEILDSIHYAKRIQNAIVSSEFYVNKELRRMKL
jgi:tetratricopeptide (TPR) repeat protein